MRHLSATEHARPDGELRALLVGGNGTARMLVEAAIGPRAAITVVDVPGALKDVAIRAHDVVLLYGELSRDQLGELVQLIEAADPDIAALLLTDDEPLARDAARHGLVGHALTGSPHLLAAAIAAELARASRARTARIDRLKRSHSMLRRREERARFLVRLADAARRLDKPDEMGQVTMRLLREALGADRCVYADVEPDGMHFTFSSVACAPGVASVEGRFPISAAVAKGLLEDGPLVVNDVATELPPGVEASVYHELDTQGLIIAPLVKGGRLTATAGVHMLSPRSWTRDEVELVDIVAERLWEAMEFARVSRTLREREDDFRGLFELSAVGVAQSDPSTGRFLRANRRFCELTGYSEEEVRRLTFTELTHPDDRPANSAAIGQVLHGNADRWDIEKRYLRRDGSSVWVHVSGQLIRDESGKPYRLIANAADITARKQAEAALIASRRQLQLVTDSAPVLLANCGTDYRYKFVNRAYAERYGLSPASLIGLEVAQVLGEEAFAQLKPYADRALAGERSDFEAEVRYRDIARQWIRCAYAPELDEQGSPVGWVAAIIDITDRKRAEQALREADRRKDEFLAVLGHELRNPLAPLRAGIELLREAEHRPELLGNLRAMMERQLSHLIHLVDDLLDLSRVTRGDVHLRCSALDMRDVIRAALELGEPMIAERRHRLEVTLPAEPLTVEGDFQRLTQVIGNLLSNAAKYTEVGGSIRVHAANESGQAAVRVADTGFGIPPDRLEYVFEMFGQVPEHRAKTGGGGIGIGLALSRQLVTLHGGTIVARSEGLGHGSEFTVLLPLAAEQPASAAEATAEAGSAPRRRVLVVDDNVDAAESLRLVLGVEGHDVEVVHGAADALDAVARFRPDVVLLDIGLPDMDGYEVARRIRARPDGAEITLFALTGWAQEEDKRRAFEAGFDRHLTKPVDGGVLRQLIAETHKRGDA